MSPRHRGGKDSLMRSLGHALLLWIGCCLLTSGTACKSVQSDPHVASSSGDAPISFVGKIISVGPRDIYAQFVLNVWRVEAEVVSKASGALDAEPKIGSHVVFFVHSIANTFYSDTNSVIGKTFQIEYATGFENPYDGSVSAK